VEEIVLDLKVVFSKFLNKEAAVEEKNNYTVNRIYNQDPFAKPCEYILATENNEVKLTINHGFSIKEVFEKTGEDLLNVLAKSKLKSKKCLDENNISDRVESDNNNMDLVFELNYSLKLGLEINDNDDFVLKANIKNNKKQYEDEKLNSIFRKLADDIYESVLNNRKIEFKL
jgi:hypothetical protein